MATSSTDPQELDDLVKSLADGFGSLLEEVKKLSQREQDLSRKLSTLSEEYLKLAATLPSSKIHDQSTTPEYSLLPPNNPLESRNILKGLDAYKRFVATMPRNLEQDFTTPGARGNLQCPFSEGRGALPTPPPGSKDVDPVKTDLPPDKFSSPPPSATGSAGKCPIRFLDQHSPEEVAQYFEEHKHEIPRSHEVCVKRYQSNSESIRQLDAKYGNLVSMIQGLGVKHQPYLKDAEGEMLDARDRTSTERVEQWAEGISIKSEIFGEGENDDRTGRFERSLRDVRLGESPSRPWGIQIPLAQEMAKSAIPSGPEITESPQKSRESRHQGTTMPVQGTERFPYSSKASPPAEKEADSNPRVSPSSLARNQNVFNGPVFFGYSADDALKMMQAGVSFSRQ